ncbi:hypothetical protein SOVF_016720 [Spinacia oleracea]|nr:hypothetical protein SOVF_016720 [Spinacia oleracea]
MAHRLIVCSGPSPTVLVAYIVYFWGCLAAFFRVMLATIEEFFGPNTIFRMFLSFVKRLRIMRTLRLMDLLRDQKREMQSKEAGLQSLFLRRVLFTEKKQS